MPSPRSRSLARGSCIAVALLLAALTSPVPRSWAELSPTEQSWNQPVEPYRIMGPLYYVGASDLAIFLITTPEGHILINSGFAETVPLIRESMRKLGFRFEDVKVLLASHAHADHVAGHVLVREATGAKVMAAEGDVGVMETGGRGDFRFEGEMSWRGTPVDRVLHDGDTVVLGGMTLTARVTPGHTRGCTTWTFDLPDGGRTRKAVIVGSMSINPGVVLVTNPKFPEIADEYARSFRILRSLPVEVFLAPHVQQFGAAAKARRLGESPNPFVDPDGYKGALDDWEKAYREQLARERAAARIFEDIPDRPDPRGRYALYVHGRILEEQGVGAVSADFGLYQYEAILQALASRGFTVISERRAGDPGADYPKKLAARVRKLLQAGVPLLTGDRGRRVEGRLPDSGHGGGAPGGRCVVRRPRRLRVFDGGAAPHVCAGASSPCTTRATASGRPANRPSRARRSYARSARSWSGRTWTTGFCIARSRTGWIRSSSGRPSRRDRVEHSPRVGFLDDSPWGE